MCSGCAHNCEGERDLEIQSDSSCAEAGTEHSTHLTVDFLRIIQEEYP